MTVHRLIQNLPLHPEDISRLRAAYEETIGALGLIDRSDQMTNFVAKKVIELYQSGIHDSGQIAELGATAVAEGRLPKRKLKQLRDGVPEAEDGDEA